MSFEPLPRVVKPGDRPFLNDGLVQLIVDQVEGKEVRCTVAVGGELRSRKGLNLPGINLGISAFTDHDRKCLEFALTCGVDAVSQSFVESSADIGMVRAANAILDGTDCVMLSGESATGNFPEESVAMLAKIATFTEVHRPRGSLALQQEMGEILVNPKAMLVERALEVAPCDAVLVTHPRRNHGPGRGRGGEHRSGWWRLVPSLQPCRGWRFRTGCTRWIWRRNLITGATTPSVCYWNSASPAGVCCWSQGHHPKIRKLTSDWNLWFSRRASGNPPPKKPAINDRLILQSAFEAQFSSMFTYLWEGRAPCRPIFLHLTRIEKND
jgi:hypothetical protein